MTNELRALPALDFQQAVKEAWSKVTQFNGRSRRSEFWWSYLAIYIGAIISGMIPLIGAVATILLELATIPLVFRRLHDTGRSGWWWGADCILSLAGATAFIINLASVLGGFFVNGPSDMEPREAFLMIFQILGNPFVLGLFFASIVIKLIILVFLCQDSQPEANQYGESPKYVLE
ncbi:MAG: DUF805 domain-containing protein [Prevotella sp.]|nr:DUF805 domain-containing protein [Prevotella sp.]